MEHNCPNTCDPIAQELIDKDHGSKVALIIGEVYQRLTWKML